MRGVSVLVLFGPSAPSRTAAGAGLEHSVRIGALERRSRAPVWTRVLRSWFSPGQVESVDATSATDNGIPA